MRKLGKKLMGAILVAALTSAMSLSVLAANNPSASKNGVVNEVASAKDANGNAVKVSFAELTAAQKEAAKEIQTTEGLKAVLGNAFVEGMKVVDVREVTVPEGTTFPLTITFKVPGVTKNSDVAILHYVNGAWQTEKATAGEGTITATFESLSPIAFVTTSAPSPKTGETSAVTTVAIIALVAAAGAYTFRKKSVVR